MFNRKDSDGLKMDNLWEFFLVHVYNSNLFIKKRTILFLLIMIFSIFNLDKEKIQNSELRQFFIWNKYGALDFENFSLEKTYGTSNLGTMILSK